MLARCPKRNDMSRNSLSFLILICVVRFSNAHEAEGLYNDLSLTESFFQILMNDYESTPPGRNLTSKLLERIADFVQELRSPIQWRHRRHLEGRVAHADGGIRVLRGFSQTYEDPFPNALTISVFTHYNGIQLQWFVATLNASCISLFLYDGNQFQRVATYPITNGSRVIADCSASACVLVASKTDGSVIILRLQPRVQGYILRPVQYLGGSADVRLSTWHGMNQMFLGISSRGKIAVYHWLGEHFDSIQILNHGTGKLTPFNIGGSICLAVTGSQTIILRFFLQPNAFKLVQRLPAADDVESFYVEKAHRREHYLVLSNRESTIIYKFVVDHFIPFQNIAKADKISSITTKETVLLLALMSSSLKIYQYNGWKYVELGATMTEVDGVYPTSLDGELILIVRHSNGTWRFNKLIWLQQSTWEVLKVEIKSWALDTVQKAKRQEPAVPELNEPVTILQGHVGKLRVGTVNGRSTDTLIQLLNRFEQLRSNLSESKLLFPQLVTRYNPKLAALRASKVSGTCTSGCRINGLATAVKSGLLDNLAKTHVRGQNLAFENVKAHSTGKLRCPRPAIAFKNVTVGRNINGFAFESVREDLLRVTGDQEITAEHVYAQLSVTSALIPLDTAARSTQQELRSRWMKADNLELVRGGILLPLNGQPVAVNDTKTVANVKITGTVHTRGNFNGTGVEKLKPVIWVREPLQLRGNYSLRKVTVTSRVVAPDLTLGSDKSLNRIVSEAVRLDGNVPVHLKLTKAVTTWSRITANITGDMITASTDQSTFAVVKNITGTKRSPNGLVVTNLNSEDLPLPKFASPICASEAIVDDVETRIVSFRRASAESLKTGYIFGASALNAVVGDTATIMSANDVTLSAKTFTGTVHVESASLDAVDGVDFRRLLTAMVSWREPGKIKGLVNASNLAVKRLLAPNGFVPPPVNTARNLFSRHNINFDTLNAADVSALVQNFVRLDEAIFFNNVAFAGLMAKRVRASVPPIDLSGTRNMGPKIIAGSLKTANLIVPYSFVYPSSSAPVNLIVEGSANFATEPKFENINGRNLGQLSESIWLADEPSVHLNGALIVEHMILRGPIRVSGWLNSKIHGPWNRTLDRVLSRSEPQVINTRVYLKAATAPNIFSSVADSKLFAPATFLDGLGERSLRKDGVQSVSTSISFQKFIIPGDLNARGGINGKNLSTDIVRFDAKENFVVGRKTVLTLHTEDLVGGLNFGEWEKNTLKVNPLNTDGPIVVNGLKTFANITLLEPLRIDGSVNGQKAENYLLKSSPQQISGVTKIHGSVTASVILTAGSVNDVDLTALTRHQLKKNKPVQLVRSLISAKGDIAITGNVGVKGLYHGVVLKDWDKLNSELESVRGRVASLKRVAEEIHAALSGGAWYWNKLELIEAKAETPIPDPVPVKPNAIDLDGLGNCVSENGVLTCDNETVRLLVFTPNTTKVLFNQVFQLAGVSLVVIATADPNGGVWIYTHDSAGKKFHQAAGLNLPGATRASAVADPTSGSLWLTVQLTSDMIILRYETWGQLEEYTLPGSELCFMEVAPTGELLLFRSDGVWRLGGVSGPRQLVRAPIVGEISTRIVGEDYYVRLARNDFASLKTRYVGN